MGEGRGGSWRGGLERAKWAWRGAWWEGVGVQEGGEKKNVRGRGWRVGGGTHLLRVKADDERGDVDDLLADAKEEENIVSTVPLVLVVCPPNSPIISPSPHASLPQVPRPMPCYSPATNADLPDVALADENTSVVNALGESALEDLRLEAALKEILDLEGKDVIETHALLVEDTDANEATDEGVSLEETLGILLVELQELTSGPTNLGQDEGDAPDFALVAETVFSSKLELGVEAGRLERATGDLVHLRVVSRGERHCKEGRQTGVSGDGVRASSRGRV